jgi:hypothetical protein
MSAGMIPALDCPGLITPGQLGPTMRVRPPLHTLYAQKATVSCTGMPSVITIAGRSPASIASMTAALAVSMLVGGRKRERQRFELRAATAQSLMLLLATVALVMPAIFQLVAGGGLPDPTARAVEFPHDLQALSVGVAVVLLASYGAGLVFSLKTHAHLFNPSQDEDEHGGEPWSVRKSVLMLAGAGAAVGWMSEILVHSITVASETIGLSPFFVGVIVVAVVGNAAEHWVSVYFAARDKMAISVNMAVGSGAQIALMLLRCWYWRRSSLAHSQWPWCSTGSSSARCSWRSSSPTRSPSAASPPGTKACNYSPSTSCSGSPSSSFDAHGPSARQCVGDD